MAASDNRSGLEAGEGASPGGERPEPAAPAKRRRGGLNRASSASLLLSVLCAAGLWGTGRMVWVQAHVRDELAGDSTHRLVGAVWDPAATPLALAILATVILSLAVSPLVRRVLGVLIVGFAAVASFRCVPLLTSGADPLRAQALLSSGAATQRQSTPDHISAWAQVLSAEVQWLPVALCLLAAAAGIVGGILLAMRPGAASSGSSRYETPQARREALDVELREQPDAHRTLWEALDAGVDPTDGLDGRAGRANPAD